MEFTQLSTYIESKSSLLAKIQAVDNLITALSNTQLDSMGNADKAEYFLDDGQSKIIVKYRDIMSIEKTVTLLENRKQKYITQLNGRVYSSIDTKNLHGRNY